MKSSLRILAPALLAALLFAACVKEQDVVYEPTRQRTADEAADGTVPDNVVNLEDILDENGAEDCAGALYSDYAFGFSELEELSLLIVRGRVMSVRPASERNLAQEAEVDISETYKGAEFPKIRLYQLCDNAVREGGEYILFLGAQYPDDPDSDVFYTVGGCQGSIELVGAGGESNLRLKLNSAAIYDEDLLNWLNANLGLGSETFCPIFEVGTAADSNAEKYGELGD